MSKKTKQDLIVSAVIYAVIGFFFASGMNMLPDSRVFPNLILGFMAAINTCNVILILSKDRKQRAAGHEEESMMTFQDAKYPLITFLGTVAYVVLFVFTNYFIATAVFIILFMLIEKIRPIWLPFVITAGYCAFIYWLFVVQLSVRLIQ